MRQYVKCLTIAGSDSGGGAGIQADLKTMSAIGVYGMSAITAVTAQNTIKVNEIYPIPPEIVSSQINSVIEDIGCDTVKIGMLYSADIVKAVASELKKFSPKNIVLDPVLISTSNCELNKENCIEAIINYLIPICSLITPNFDECYKLTGIKPSNWKNVHLAAKKFIGYGAKAVLIKGGHNIKGKYSTDYLLTNKGFEYYYKSVAINTTNLHGTGCTLSSAITSYLALGYNLHEAILRAKRYISNAIKHGTNITTGQGCGPVNHFYSPKKLIIK
ncbi:MAG: bifunctional hydroxymethylpyrimidine kinase/phosphomethylpyrimidine kinase [Bacteroidales bacterium]|nr:bifunctional hydroxymethylpyrimidine kinase/phosphomethylpyrimidine kinase [Bacteroidales bacterium]